MNTDTIKDKLLFWKDYYPTKSIIWRNRGNTYSPELTDAARIKYPDNPNAHIFRTGEETKAAPLDYVSTTTGGQPFIMWVEPEDGQLVPFKLDLDDVQFEKTSDGEYESAKIQAAVLDNKDERLNFWTNHLEESEDKYTIPGFIAENERLVLLMTTAIAVSVIMFATAQGWGEAVPYLKQLTSQMPSLTNAIQSMNTGGAPPGS